MIIANTLLMPFDCFIDIDLGLMKLLKEKYNNPKIVYDSILREKEWYIKYLLLNRTDENSLSIILKEEYQPNRDVLRCQFIKKEYDAILRLSKPNKIFELISMMYASDAVDIDILCSDVREQEYLTKLFKDRKINSFVAQHLNKVDIRKYDTIFIKNYKDILRYRGLIQKNIYVLDYKFNTELDPNNKLRPIVIVEGLISDKNTTNIISPYDMSQVQILG